MVWLSVQAAPSRFKDPSGLICPFSLQQQADTTLSGAHCLVLAVPPCLGALFHGLLPDRLMIHLPDNMTYITRSVYQNTCLKYHSLTEISAGRLVCGNLAVQESNIGGRPTCAEKHVQESNIGGRPTFAEKHLTDSSLAHCKLCRSRRNCARSIRGRQLADWHGCNPA